MTWNSHNSAFVLFLIIQIFGTCSNVLNYISNASTWNEARQICFAQNGWLMEPDKDKISPFIDCYKQTSDNIWLGKYSSISPWMELYGCYNVTDSFKSKHETHTTENFHPATCFKLCKSDIYIGMQPNKCICLGTGETVLGFEKTGPKACNISCSAHDSLYCGSENQIAIYSKDVTQSANCSAIDYLCPTVDCQNIQVAECDYNDAMVCDNNSQDDINSNLTYNLARCLSTFGSYSLFLSKEPTVCNNSVRSSWSGIFKTVSVYKYHEHVDKEDLLDCYYLKRNGTNCKVEASDCNEKIPFICEIDDAENKDIICGISTGFTPVWTTDASSHFVSNVIHTGTIVGIVCGILLLVVALLGTFIIIKRRKHSKKSTQPGTTDNIQPETNTHIYSQVNKIKTTKTTESNVTKLVLEGDLHAGPCDAYDNSAKTCFQNGCELANMHCNISNSDNVYTVTDEGEYDLLHDNKGRRVAQLNKGSNLYAHTTPFNANSDDEMTYDTTQVKEPYEKGVKTYDHTHFRKNKEVSHYD